MFIYFLIIIIIFLLWLQCHSSMEPDIQFVWRKRCCIISSMLLVIVAALRGAGVGADTASYIRDYALVKKYTFQQIVELYSDNPGYFIISKIFADAGLSVQVWFAIVAAIYIYAVTRLIFRFSKDPGFSYILFITVGFYAFSLAGLKQTLAMALVFMAYRYLYDSKYIRFGVLMLLASLCHLSSIVFLFSIVIHFLKNTRFYYAFLTITFFIWIASYNVIASSFLTNLNFEHYSSYLNMQKEAGGTLTMFFILLLMQLVSIIYMRFYTDEDRNEARDIFGMSYLGIITQILSLVAASAFRVGLYFSLFSIILLPNCVDMELNAKTRRLMKLGITLVFCFYFWYANHNGSSVVPYIFFWEN